MMQTAAPAESAGLRTAMVPATIIGGLLLMLSAWPLAMSPMVFDSGESADTWGVFIAIWMMPVVLIAGLVTGWVGSARNARNVVIGGLALSALPVLATVGILVMSGF
jgi:hypothetical protein